MDDDGTQGPSSADSGDASGGDIRAKTPALRPGGGGSILPPAPPAPAGDEEEGMLRMSFLEHLEELRTRIIRSLYGLLIAFIASILLAQYLWEVISQPAVTALKHLGVNPPRLVMIEPLEGFSIIWIKMPLLVSIFLASPWILYQVWAFIAPGLYKRERRMATPFILTTAGLFILGGLFAYFVVFRLGIEFLLGLGLMNNVQPMVTITEYFDLFVNVTLGVAIVFELPVLIFFLTLIRVASPRFLMRHSRYAILGIVIAAAIITPTPDVFNLMLFAIPMNLLYFLGVFASYLLVLRREGRSFPWAKVLTWTLAVLLVLVAAAYGAMRLGYKVVPHWPYLTR
jgi:sec-independent protein translocase protein TatC